MFFLDMALAATLGLGTQSDILYAAWSLPLTIGRGMFQSLTNSFMGMFAEVEDTTIPYRQAITVIGVVSLVVAALMSMTARWWFPLSVLGADLQTRSAGQQPAAVLAWLIALLGPAETFRAVYYRAGHLILPSAGRIAGALTSIVIALVAGRQGNLMLVAWGLVAGAAVETLIGFIGFYILLSFRYRFAWPDRKTLGDMTRIVGLPLMGQGIRVLAGVGERALASYLGPGALTAVTFATRLVTTLDRFIFRGFLVATIQTYTDGTQQDYNSRLRLIALLATPIGVVFALLSPQLIGAAFGRGRFTAEDVVVVSQTIQTYAPAIIGLALTSVPLGLAYARKQSRAVLGFFALSSFLLVTVEYLLIRIGFDLRSFGVALMMSTFAALIWLSRSAGREMTLWLRHDTGQLLAVLGIVLSGTFGVRAVTELVFTGQWAAWAQLLIGGMAAMIFTLFAARLLHMQEFDQIARLIRLRPGPTRI